MPIKKGKIGNALESVAPDHTVTTADQIFDETIGKYQSEINQEGGGGGGTPAMYIKDAEVSQDGQTLTLTKKDDTEVEFSPESTDLSLVSDALCSNSICYWGKDFPSEIRSSILFIQLRTTKDYRKDKLYIKQFGIIQEYNGFYIYVNNAQDQTIAVYGITETSAGGFTGKKTVMMENVADSASDKSSIIVATIDFDILSTSSVTYSTSDLQNGHCPIIKPTVYRNVPVESSTGFPGIAVDGAVSQCVGVISWGRFYNMVISDYLKSVILEVSDDEYQSHRIVIKTVEILNNNFYICLYDLTLSSTFGWYYVENASSLTGESILVMSSASDSNLDSLSRVIVCVDFDKYEIFDLGATNTLYAPRVFPQYVKQDGVSPLPFVKGLRVWVPESEVNVNYGITLLGYNSQYQRFYLRLRNNTSGSDFVYGYKNYPSGVPSTGTETISFIMNLGRSNQYFYYAELDIDWSEYNSSYSINVYPKTIPFTVKPTSSLSEIHGDIDVEEVGSIIYIPEGCNLYGKDCTINMYDDGIRIILSSNSSLNDITFVDKSSVAITTREEYSSSEIAQNDNLRYIYKPLITRTDLQNTTVYLVFGHDSAQIFVVKIDGGIVNARVSGCTFKYFNRPAIFDGLHTDRHTTPAHSCVCNNMFINCRTGIFAGEEFTRNYGNYFFGCILGIVLRSANFNSVNNLFVRCDCGMYFLADNTAHGEVSTYEFAHIGVAAVYAKTIGNGLGFIFTNCQIAQGPVIAESAYALKFQSCRLDTYFIISSGAKNSFIGNNMLKNYAAGDGVTNIFDVPSDTVITLNRSMNSSQDDSLYNKS